MSLSRIALVVSFGVLLGVPLVVGPKRARPSAGVPRLIIITPHNEQIRSEFARAFDDWHRRHYGNGVNVVWSVPGGTSEIRRMLRAQYTAALVAGVEPGQTADLLFGGGSNEHEQLKEPLVVTVDGQQRSTTITIPAGFDDQWLWETYGENTIGDRRLYDEGQHWFGTALSGFGIVFNRDVLAELGVPEPSTWEDLADPALRGWVALVNPGQSGSITTAFQSIVDERGWGPGWRLLRRAGANARSFSAGAPKAPIDVSLGDAAAGICIDFFGRYQAQAVKGSGNRSRLGYVDPPGATTIDADPISILRGAPAPEIARRFIEFCLSDQGQALWQFRVDDPIGDGLGPTRFELRRMPIVRSLYERHLDRFVDQVNPYTLARAVEKPTPHVRPFVAPVFAAMAIDNRRDLQRAWEAIVTHSGYPTTRRIVTAADVDDPALRRMLELFDAMPEGLGPDGSALPLESANLDRIRQGWERASLWPPADPKHVARRRFARFFGDNYREILRQAEAG
ncbi:MAG: ABC transporter substrate-binding protein [Planctomycetota bacterium]|jgi:ABC-type Fe3+ transport system substrate-binding protein